MTVVHEVVDALTLNFNPHSARGMTGHIAGDGASPLEFQSTFRTRNDSTAGYMAAPVRKISIHIPHAE